MVWRANIHVFLLWYLWLAFLPCRVLSAPQIPSGVIEQIDPGRTSEELAPDYKPPPLYGPEILQHPKPRTSQPIVQGITFQLKGVKFNGNTVFTNEQLQTICTAKKLRRISHSNMPH